MHESQRFGGAVSRLAAAFVVALTWTMNARADLLVQTASVPLTTTNWTNHLVVPRFDPGLGRLERIDLDLDGAIQGEVRFESLDAAATTISSLLSAHIVVQRPDTSVLAVATPTSARMDDVTRFDGLIDFAGGSGRTYTLTTNLSSFESLTDASDLTLFTGLDNILLPVLASADSAVGGAGSLVASVSSGASAEATLTYHYVPVPAPSAVMLATVGFGLVGWVKRRTRCAGL